MSQNEWSEVDDYIVRRLVPHDQALQESLAANAAAGLPAIDVSPNQGKLLYLIARMAGARRVLEIGTLGGYSTIWLARALPPDGVIVTLEAERRHAEVARRNLDRAGLADRVEIRVGRALETLPQIEAEGLAPFDLIFIDADKPNNPHYLAWALRLARQGTVIIGDNVVRDGAVADATSVDPGVVGTRQFFDMIAAEPRLDATAIQTVGSKGWDGLMLAIVL
jgi:predicted O-methyltransferase YrrM